MRYELEYANSFKKDLKTCKKRGYNLTLLQEVIDLLQTTGTLPERYRPHKLSGSYEGLWECHIKGDWLLIWQQNDTELILIMTDTGTHADLSSYLRHRYRLCLIRFINSSRVFGLLEESGEIRGCRQGVLLLDTTHLHTHMLCLDHDHHA